MATTKEIIHRFLGQLFMQLFYPMLYLHIPWVCYALLSLLSINVSVAVSISFLIFMAMNLKSLQQKMLLSWASLFAFLLSFFSMTLLSKRQHTLWLIPQLIFIVTIILSLLFKKPFTLQYAKLVTAKNRWNTPLFFKVNFFLASLWLFYFFLSALLTLAEYYFKWPLSWCSFFLLWGTSRLHDKFPHYYLDHLREERLSSRNF